MGLWANQQTSEYSYSLFYKVGFQVVSELGEVQMRKYSWQHSESYKTTVLSLLYILGLPGSFFSPSHMGVLSC